jgi:hypothetical protein
VVVLFLKEVPLRGPGAAAQQDKPPLSTSRPKEA